MRTKYLVVGLCVGFCVTIALMGARLYVRMPAHFHGTNVAQY